MSLSVFKGAACKFWIVVIGLLSLSGNDGCAGENPVILQSHILAPYLEKVSGRLTGQLPQTLDCVFKQIERPYEIHVAPRKRSRVILENHQADGFFLSMPDEDMDKIAKASDPIALERWRFFYRQSNGYKRPEKGELIGVVLGSNEELWIRRTQRYKYIGVPKMESLVHLLHKGRLPYVLSDDRAFGTESFRLGFAPGQTESGFVRYTPLVAYFSHKFLGDNQGFLPKFNTALTKCVHEERQLHSQERDKVVSIVGQVLKADGDFILRFLQQVSVRRPSKENMVADDLWRRAVLANEKTPIMEEVLSNALSQHLRTIAHKYPMITELFVTDIEGFNQGMNLLTSDFWQGDEAAFASLRAGDTYFVSGIMFDHSTHKFQIQASTHIRDPKTKKPLGMITIGFDADKTFSILQK